jgi:PhzF family phenazine biosynthesis protein
MKRRFRQVDVFGEHPCAGNPVAVVLDAESLDDEAMRRFAVWSNLSECTFVLSPTTPGADPRLEQPGRGLMPEAVRRPRELSYRSAVRD